MVGGWGEELGQEADGVAVAARHGVGVDVDGGGGAGVAERSTSCCTRLRTTDRNRSGIPMGVYYSGLGTNPPGVSVELAGTPLIESEETDVQLPEEVLSDLRKRLRRVPVRYKASSGCWTTVASAATSSPRSPPQPRPRTGWIPAGRRGLTYCLAHPEEAEADGYPIDEVEKMFMRLA